MVFDFTDESHPTLFKDVQFYIWPTRWAEPSEELALFIRVSRVCELIPSCTVLTRCSAERGQVLRLARVGLDTQRTRHACQGTGPRARRPYGERFAGVAQQGRRRGSPVYLLGVSSSLLPNRSDDQPQEGGEAAALRPYVRWNTICFLL